VLEERLYGVCLSPQHDPTVPIAIGQDPAARIEACFGQQAKGESDLSIIPDCQFCRFTDHGTEYDSNGFSQMLPRHLGARLPGGRQSSRSNPAIRPADALWTALTEVPLTR
jgi:hypothetical protein